MLKNAKRIVVKVGSSLLIGEDKHLRKEWLQSLAEDIRDFKKEKKQIIVVTSGAVALGRHVLNYGARALTLEEKQAAAACGQAPLLNGWWHAFGGGTTENISDWMYPALVLLTADDSINRRRYLNARNTLETLLEDERIIPVVNENDTVATQELRFGDNDRLAARVAQMAGADLLILLSDIDGLYTADPGQDAKAKFIPEVKEINADIEKMAGGAGSAVSSGGMRTKIEAAKIATQAGCHMVIARGTESHPLKKLAGGGKHTHFAALGNPKSARKHWIAGSVHPAGSVVVDAGAAKALQSGKSLLPAGVTAVEGVFDRGDTVLIKDQNGATLGKGLSAYAAEDAVRILGRKSEDIEKILGFKGRSVLIHRDDMVLS